MKKYLLIVLLYVLVSTIAYPFRGGGWYHLVFTMAYTIAVLIYFRLVKKDWRKK